MNGTSNTKLPVDPQGERLTLRQSRNALLRTLGLVLLLAPLGFYSLRQKWGNQAAILCCLTVIQLLNLRALWTQYCLIKQGVEVYTPPQMVLSVPKPISAVVTSVLTGLVGICSVSGAYIAYSRFNTLGGWAIAGAVLLPLWTYTGYCWYRIVSEKGRVLSAKPPEQPEGVWLPAPRPHTKVDTEFPK